MLARVHSIHFDADTRLIRFIQKKMKSLDHYVRHHEAGEADVVLRLENTGGAVRQKVVGIKVLIPGKPLLATAAASGFEEAFSMAWAQAKRQIIRRKEIIRSRF